MLIGVITEGERGGGGGGIGWGEQVESVVHVYLIGQTEQFTILNTHNSNGSHSIRYHNE